MALNTVTNQFLAALGIERRLEKAVEDHLRHFHWKVLTAYRAEVQYERAKLMRRTPLDYRAVRNLDREMDDIHTRLRDMELEQMS